LRFETTPRASTNRSKAISRFSRSISASGMRAILVLFCRVVSEKAVKRYR
jgi:hypothetical protein